LKPDDSGLDLRFEISGKEILEIERKHGINQCAIYMVIKYKNALGTEIEREILVGGYDEGNLRITVLSNSNVID